MTANPPFATSVPDWTVQARMLPHDPLSRDLAPLLLPATEAVDGALRRLFPAAAAHLPSMARLRAWVVRDPARGVVRAHIFRVRITKPAAGTVPPPPPPELKAWWAQVPAGSERLGAVIFPLELTNAVLDPTRGGLTTSVSASSLSESSMPPGAAATSDRIRSASSASATSQSDAASISLLPTSASANSLASVASGGGADSYESDPMRDSHALLVDDARGPKAAPYALALMASADAALVRKWVLGDPDPVLAEGGVADDLAREQEKNAWGIADYAAQVAVFGTVAAGLAFAMFVG
ncbi:hypothetical protein BC828DRAFT_409312 [Blastocladiella britannica]|nr:hypothetical protein BC828DRAFT_409312 [Blastocladiella britannica]